LVAWAKNKTAATGEAQKMILEDRKEHRGYDVTYVTSIIARRKNMHGKLKGSHKVKKARQAQQRVQRALPEREGNGGIVERWDAC
jgi:hypothetical protein